MDSKMAAMYLGVLLIIIALILGGMEYFMIYDFKPVLSRLLYIYGLFGIIGLIGIILIAWGMLKKEAPASAEKPAPTKTTRLGNCSRNPLFLSLPLRRVSARG